MVHFSIHQLTASLSPKNVRSGLRLRKRKTSNASSTASDMMRSPSNVSIASSTIYRRCGSMESIVSTSTAASSAILDVCNDLGLTTPYHKPAHAVLRPSKKHEEPLRRPQRTMTGYSTASSSLSGGMTQIDLFGFHHSFMDAEEESFSPELVILEPRPDTHRFCGFEETLEQRPMLPFRL
ncbi:hypothetical protein DRE_01344 [Drechslerella stenobrocha 248]|uniref:Uncharacterized protein n=1 Tax=Drechslerella stenobrocha 248 TaxID=1043628 RepID=W7HVC3_9PEZI|nr:hypothetical protein DRE_01344 [Drechslerella stenobrocha 248]